MKNNDLFSLIDTLPYVSALDEAKGNLISDDTLGPALAILSLFNKKKANYCIVSPNQYSCQRLYEFLLNFLPEENVVFFPSDELLRAEALSSSLELQSQRIYAMYRLLDDKKKILVTHPSAILRFLPSRKQFEERVIKLKVGDTLDLKEFKTKLLENGYKANDKIEHSLQFAYRGDIVDVYSVSYLDPIRIEFFDDEIESIRLFDIATQESKSTLKEVSIAPATDFFLPSSMFEEFKKAALDRLSKDEEELPLERFNDLKRNLESVLEDYQNNNYKISLYKYYGLANKDASSIVSYFDPRFVFFPNYPQFCESFSLLQTEANQYFGELFYQGQCLSHLEQYLSLDKALKGIKSIHGSIFSTSINDVSFPVHSISLTGKSIASILPTIQSYLTSANKVIICLKEEQQRKTIKSLLEDAKLEIEVVNGLEIPSSSLAFSSLNLSEGFENPSLKIAYISSNELFGARRVASRFNSRFKQATILRSYEELKPGDYVVHEYNGIGQFLDIKTIEIEGKHRDFLHIAYAGNEFLYVPLEQFRLVRKYAGREGARPQLSRLSTKEWEKRKSKINKRINELADRLISLYGNRVRNKGFAFPADDELQKQFENEFPYQLTSDQQAAVDAIKKDMESNEIMDRLVCGDVGFGKTEVAFRAAFKAISNGKQVALLCPTTLLARQHYEVAMQRFATFGVRLALFSRLIPDSVQNQNLKAIKEGKIDFIIGTHRLLSKDFEFKDLGLLIVDEEQRFGVEQKERIKEMKNSVDVLTLSATPIPRTLQMSLVGIRPMSEINTAPSSRMPIQTYVTPYKEEIVDELISRELSRNGQVYYVHNRVDTIYSCASKLASRIPLAKIGVVHGQMDKNESEDVMAKFYDNELNVLVCTSIVENGIDIPNANMIIVENADNFGLSQLYQIKGRVGRGNRISYAYLMYKPHKNMNEDAKKRLQAIQEFTELGSGYKIAQRDLMIRGAGDILGPEQAGFIDSVGLDLYMKMLNEAIEAKKSGIELTPPTSNKLFDIDAYIPSDYASKSDKIVLYQELENINKESDLNKFAKKVRDIYGKMPEETSLLIKKKLIDILSDFEEFTSVNDCEDKVDLSLSSSFSRIDGIGSDLFNSLLPMMNRLRVTFLNKVLVVSLYKQGNWLDDLEKVMRNIHSVYLAHKQKS